MTTEFEFSIVLGSSADPDMPDLDDRLFEAGCSDVRVCAYGSTVYLEFRREASTAKKHQLLKLYKDINSAGFDILSIEEGGCASIIALTLCPPVRTLPS